MFINGIQGRNRGENLVATSAMVVRICPAPPPLGGDRVKGSENVGVTVVVSFAPVDTSLVL